MRKSVYYARSGFMRDLRIPLVRIYFEVPSTVYNTYPVLVRGRMMLGSEF